MITRILTALGVLAGAHFAQAASVTVFAAASLYSALDAIEVEFEAATGIDLVVSFAGSSALARQIQQGAPADIFISASTDWMDQLQQEDLLIPETRRDLVMNALVLIGHDRDAPSVVLDSRLDLVALVGQSRLAMALVDAVPAGIYGKAALGSLGLWDAIEPRVAQADNVRAALRLVASGEASHGIVYATDVQSEPRVRQLAVFPHDSHPPIVYPIAAIKLRDRASQDQFLRFLSSPQARDAFARQGFIVNF